MSDDKKKENKESSLTAPSDRDRSTKWKPNQFAPPLTIRQTNQAMNALNNDSFVARFPQVERRYADPPIDLQKIGLISFVPAKDAKPNKNGVFGFAKLRGNYANPIEANERAADLIRNVDSYHQIYHTYVGRPFPITVSSNYSKEVDRVELNREMKKTISDDVKQKREKERKEMDEIRAREKALMERNAKVGQDPDQKEPETPETQLDNYITLRVKKAQLTWNYLEHKKKEAEIIKILGQLKLDIEENEEKYPDHRNQYFEKYKNARKEVGLDVKQLEGNFMRFMVEDKIIPEVEEEYNRLKNGGNKEDEKDEKQPEIVIN